MKNLSENILKKIREKDLKPKPKWLFDLKWGGILLAFLFAIIFGGVFFGLILSKMMEFDYDFHDRVASPRFIGLLFLIFPYFWLIFFGIFLFGAYYYLKHTKHGYRYSFLQVTFINIIATILLGILLFMSGFTDFLQTRIRNSVPLYQKMFYSRDHMWMMEERGLLGGEIIKIIDGNNFELRDFRNKLWIVSIPVEVNLEKPLIQVGSKVRMIGEKKSKGVFEAKGIKPWERGEGMMMRRMKE